MLTVREAVPEEHGEVRELLRAAYAGYAAHVAPEVYPVYLRDVLDLDAAGATVLVALEDGAVVGTARLHLRPADAGLPDGAAYVRGVAACPGRAGRGVGRALMASCAQRAAAAAATGLWLHTAPFMTRAIRLYESLGYRREPGHDTNSRKHYGLLVEPLLRALAYRLDLASPRSTPATGLAS